MSKPLVTFALFAYNQERFVREAVRSALAQTYSPLEIILSDDCSQDETFEIIEEEVSGYIGPHMVLTNRNDRNLGIGAHVNCVMELTKGKLIVVAAGDDVSLPYRTEEIARVWTSEEVFSIHSNMIVMDEDGMETGALAPFKLLLAKSWQEIVRAGHGVYGPAHAWDRTVFDMFGPLPDGVVYEDRVIALRSALLGKIGYVDNCLVKYRRHKENITKGKHDFAQMGRFQLLKYEAIQAHRDRTSYECWLRDIRFFSSMHPEMLAEALRAMEIIAAKIELCNLIEAAEDNRANICWRSYVRAVKNLKKTGVKPVAKAYLLNFSPMAYSNLQRWRARFAQ